MNTRACNARVNTDVPNGVLQHTNTEVELEWYRGLLSDILHSEKPLMTVKFELQNQHGLGVKLKVTSFYVGSNLCQSSCAVNLALIYLVRSLMLSF